MKKYIFILFKMQILQLIAQVTIHIRKIKINK